jgi:hypothetical protein
VLGDALRLRVSSLYLQACLKAIDYALEHFSEGNFPVRISTTFFESLHIASGGPSGDVNVQLPINAHLLG